MASGRMMTAPPWRPLTTGPCRLLAWVAIFAIGIGASFACLCAEMATS